MKPKMITHTLEPAAPWEQLGITEAAYRERERIANQLAASQKGPDEPEAENSAQSADKPSIAAEAPARAPRSDKGTKRAPKVQTLSIETVSAMSTDQAQELIRLIAARNETLKNWEDAQREAQKCEADFKLDAKALQEFIEALAVTK